MAMPFTAFADYSAEEAVCRVNFFEETLNILSKCAAGAAFEVWLYMINDTKEDDAKEAY